MGVGISSSRLTRTTVGLATVLLPHGAVRDRYRRELAAELESLPSAKRWRAALGMAVSAYALRRAVLRTSLASAPGVAKTKPVPLRCRLHISHEWHNETTEDGQRYRRCLRCGLDDDGILSGRFPDHNEMVLSFWGNRT